MLRHGRVYRAGACWTGKHQHWLGIQRFADHQLQATFTHYRAVAATCDAQVTAIEADLTEAATQRPFADAVARLAAYRGDGTGATVGVAEERSGAEANWTEGGQGMRAARRPQGAVGLDAVDLLAERAMRSGRRVGLVIGCLQGGQQRVVGYGRVRTDAQDLPDGGTIFEVGSVTKVFTGLLLADLAEHGMVGLEDPLASYLPASVRVPSFGGHQITLGDLASHAGGLPRDPKDTLRRWLRDRRNPYEGLSVESLYAGLARTRLRRRPGERVKYSNLGAGLLGQALARAAGQPYEELVRERICLPLGMRDTVVTPTGEQTARLVIGYTRRGRAAPPFEIPALVGAGGLRSTATDMLCLLRATLDPARTPLAAQIERTQLPGLRVAKRVEVGLGWLIARPPGAAGPVLWHNGGTSGFRSFVGAAQQTGTAVVVLSNTARSVDRLGLRLLKALASAAG
jgi:CubicO group peptidase (beta-lactamase class C family)